MATHDVAGATTPPCTARPPATASASATPSLFAEVEQDYAVYGDECLHGGGKTLRDGLRAWRRASPAPRARSTS